MQLSRHGSVQYAAHRKQGVLLCLDHTASLGVRVSTFLEKRVRYGRENFDMRVRGDRWWKNPGG